MYQSKSSLEVAVEAAARVDALLAKKGRIKPNHITSVLSTSSKSSMDLFQTEFDINDVPSTARNLLTKGITQEEINHFSGASISTRGRYVHPEDKGRLPKGERPLYLFIQGPNKQSLDLAIQRIDSLIKEVMEQEKFKMGPPPMIQMQTSLPGMEKVIIGLEHAPPTFDVRGKVLGPGGANLQYISNETGAVVTLRGRTSEYPEPGTGHESPEPLHVCVEHPNIEVLQMGRQLAFNLIETIQQEFNQLYPQMQQPPLQVPLQPGQLEVLQQDPLAVITTPMQGLAGISPQPTPVNQLVNMPPPSLGVPPALQAQPHMALPPPGVHIPSQQGPMVPPPPQMNPQPQANQQQVNVPLTSLPPPAIGQPQMLQLIMSQPSHVMNSSQPPPGMQSQAVSLSQTTVVPALQYIQANGQLMMVQPQVKEGQVQLIAGGGHQQTTQLHLIPAHHAHAQQLVVQPQQQVTMLVQYQQPGDAGVRGRLGGVQQRLATPLQIQLQPGVQLLQPGQQVQLQLQQPIHQQIVQQAVRALSPQQMIESRPTGALQPPDQPQVQLQLQQIQFEQTKTQAIVMEQKIQQQLHRLQQVHHPQPGQSEMPQQQVTVQHLPPQQTPDQQPQPPNQLHPPGQHQVMQQLQHVQQQKSKQQLALPPNQQAVHQQQQSQQIQHQQMPQHQPHMVHQQQVLYHQQQHINQNPVPVQQVVHQPKNQQITPNQQHMLIHPHIQQQQNNQQLQAMQQTQQFQHQPPQQQTPPQGHTMQQMPQNQPPRNQQPGPNNVVPTSQHQQQQQQQQHGQKRRHDEAEHHSPNFYQSPPKPVPPPKLPPSTKQPVTGVGAGQKAGTSEISYLLPQIQKQLMPPPPPPQKGAPDDWRNNSSEQMHQQNRGCHPSQPAESGARHTFTHYSSKPHLYNAAMPFHVHPPPPPPPPPLPNPAASQYPFYQHGPHGPPGPNRYPHFMMQQQ